MIRIWINRFQTWLSMQAICGWCHRRLSGNPLSKNISHGICMPCAKKLIAKINSQNPH